MPDSPLTTHGKALSGPVSSWNSERLVKATAAETWKAGTGRQFTTCFLCFRV